MDLCLKFEDTILYIRVAAFIKTSKGYLFEKSKKGYLFTPGGKVKINESLKDAIIREVEEELGIKIENPILNGIIENNYSNENEKIKEICFVFVTQTIFNEVVPTNMIEVALEELANFDIRPQQVISLIKDNNNNNNFHLA